MLRFLIHHLIRFYQTWLSPYKGYRCAHQVVHGQGSCSQYGLTVFDEHPFWDAWRLLRGRFRECGIARQVYLTAAEEDERKRRQSANAGVCDGLGALECVEIDGCGGCESFDLGCDGCEVGSCGS
jgi:putative component of membrane protein insertase Oxa1/YidC/SpoIIIJ protein YidD